MSQRRLKQQSINLTPLGIRAHLGLEKSTYKCTAECGHFGRASDGDGEISQKKISFFSDILAKL